MSILFPERPTKHPRAGFTLVELSIVLVIVSVVIAGVFIGKNLLRNAELRKVVTEYEQFKSAVKSFQEKYHYIPGDMPTATQFWGLAGGTTDQNDSWCRDADPVDGRTCNGNDDGRIDFNPKLEYQTFWEHLANAGLIAHQTNGIRFNDANVPSAVKYMKWTARAISLDEADDDFGQYFFEREYGNVLAIGKMVCGPESYLDECLWRKGIYVPYEALAKVGGGFTPVETWNIDTKIDDGKPHRGSVVVASQYYSCSSDSDTSPDINAVYDMDSSRPKCAILFANAYEPRD